MRTKKVLAGVVASLMLAAAMPTVMAADSFGVTISNQKVAAGEEFKLTMDVSDIPAEGINACDFGIKYDSSVLTISDVALGDIASAKDNSTVEGMPGPFEYGVEDGLISVIYGLGTTDSSYYIKGSGTFLTITGTVSETAAAGKYDLSVVAVDRKGKDDATNTDVIFANYDANGKATVYTPTFTDGYVEVEGDTTEPTEATEPTTEASQPSIEFGEVTKLGDVDVDGVVGATDAVLLNKYLLAPTEYPLASPTAYANADCITDKKIDLSDSSAIVGVVTGILKESDLGPAK